jgi:hypothetical protein
MRRAIDDFPSLSASRLRAAGEIGPDDRTTTVSFPEAGVSFVVGLQHIRFPNGGGWSFFQCPCGRLARTLRLYEGCELACHRCLGARGFRPRVQLIETHKRAAYLVPRLLARLTSNEPARLHPRPGRVLDRRPRLEAKLRRSQIVARQHALDEHDEQLARNP